MLLSGVREEGLREEEHLQDSRERQGARGHRHLRRRREGHDGVRHQDQAQQESLRSHAAAGFVQGDQADQMLTLIIVLFWCLKSKYLTLPMSVRVEEGSS